MVRKSSVRRKPVSGKTIIGVGVVCAIVALIAAAIGGPASANAEPKPSLVVSQTTSSVETAIFLGDPTSPAEVTAQAAKKFYTADFRPIGKNLFTVQATWTKVSSSSQCLNMTAFTHVWVTEGTRGHLSGNLFKEIRFQVLVGNRVVQDTGIRNVGPTISEIQFGGCGSYYDPRRNIKGRVIGTLYNNNDYLLEVND